MKDSRNTHSGAEKVRYLHDMASCMRAKETHKLLDDSGVNFFRGYGYGRWPGNSPDLNPGEHVGAVVKSKAEKKLMRVRGNRNTRETLIRVLKSVLKEMENDTELFTNLLKSFHHRVQLVREANGKSIKQY